MGVASERVAKSVKIGDGGPKDVYAYDASKATNPADALKKMKTPK
jgi:hypothetical protein